ncbi:DUF3892 domain-containing protein [Bacillus suaedae]|uniref:DUF3892 domain-containing protein n=1 Tax=Halalkalibacter suaedae TaxID=2822140 RepID=A0A940WZ19_9BACI|nr:DUF3892 domain-containing protein [Bacillus suaedae]MBP3950724.1 DUF3892 domain-containing protein [Bacillus suaedae]
MELNNYQQIFNQYKEEGLKQAKSENLTESASSLEEQVVAVRKNDEGDIIAFKTNTGRELDYISALTEAKEGRLAHIDVFHKYGRDIIRSEPDGIKENNLDQLPLF